MLFLAEIGMTMSKIAFFLGGKEDVLFEVWKSGIGFVSLILFLDMW